MDFGCIGPLGFVLCLHCAAEVFGGRRRFARRERVRTYHLRLCADECYELRVSGARL